MRHANRGQSFLRKFSTVSFRICICSDCWDQSFSQTYLFFRIKPFENSSVLFDFAYDNNYLSFCCISVFSLQFIVVSDNTYPSFFYHSVFSIQFNMISDNSYTYLSFLCHFSTYINSLLLITVKHDIWQYLHALEVLFRYFI